MRYISIILDGKIVDQKPTTMADEEVVALDDMLQKCGLLVTGTEIAVTEDIPEDCVEECNEAHLVHDVKCPDCNRPLGEFECDCYWEDGLFV